MSKMNLALQQKQDMKMTAELRQAIEMLQLSALEVEAMVQRELAENPCLEAEDQNNQDYQEDKNEGRDEEGWDSLYEEGASGPAGETYGESSSYGNDSENSPFNSLSSGEKTLQQHLTEQYETIVTDPKLRFVGRYLIDAIDESGYLRLDIIDVANRLKVNLDLVDDARAILQTLEPAGVFAQNLAECLRLQLHAKDSLTPAAEGLLNHLDKLASRDFQALQRLLKIDETTLLETIADLRECNPKPGAGYASSRVEVVVPDVVVIKEENDWRVELNAAAFPRLQVIPPASMSGKNVKEAKAYMNERHGKARWLVQALEQRARTVLKVARAIVLAQKGFFDAGVEFLQPLTLRQIAEQVGVHESTVSRVTSGKFMQTPMGVFEFKYFFSSAIGSMGGNVQVASNSVQAMIQRLVKAEDPKKPLSDEQLVKLLQAEGVDVARRTIAKYRGILGIPGTAERRVR